MSYQQLLKEIKNCHDVAQLKARLTSGRFKRYVSSMPEEKIDSDQFHLMTAAIVKRLTHFIQSKKNDFSAEITAFLTYSDNDISIPTLLLQHVTLPAEYHSTYLWDLLFLFKALLRKDHKAASVLADLLMKVSNGTSIGHQASTYGHVSPMYVWLLNHFNKYGVTEDTIFKLLSLQDNKGMTFADRLIKYNDESIVEDYFAFLSSLITTKERATKLIALWSIQQLESGDTFGHVLAKNANDKVAVYYLAQCRRMLRNQIDISQLAPMLLLQNKQRHSVVNAWAKKGKNKTVQVFLDLCRHLLRHQADVNVVAQFFAQENGRPNFPFYACNFLNTETNTQLFSTLDALKEAGLDPTTLLSLMRLSMLRQNGGTVETTIGYFIADDPFLNKADFVTIARQYVAFIVTLHQAGANLDAIHALFSLKNITADKPKKVKEGFCDIILRKYPDQAGEILYPLFNHGLLPLSHYKPALRKPLLAYMLTFTGDELETVRDRIADQDDSIGRLFWQKHSCLFFQREPTLSSVVSKKLDERQHINPRKNEF